MRKLFQIKPKKRIEEPASFHVEDVDEITDEIEKSLWLIKESFDLPTEEVQISVESRRNSIRMRKKINPSK